MELVSKEALSVLQSARYVISKGSFNLSAEEALNFRGFVSQLQEIIQGVEEALKKSQEPVELAPEVQSVKRRKK